MTTTNHTDNADLLSLQYRTLADRITSLLHATDSRSLHRPSPCEGWDGADVVEHMITTQRDFLGRHTTMPELTATEPIERWQQHVAQVGALLADGIGETHLEGYFGPTTLGATLARFYGFDMVVHRWDIGAAIGVDVVWDQDELAQTETSIDGFGDHLYADGICAEPIEPGPGATRQQRLLARMGRRGVGAIA
ncbi:maleylpyruvate isomerase family mycothiol-dependent enzyme [Pseudactinotalea suaedae]|uniref:maleylpyruvate isomerase family mycothiol-dependent enzyme n=1 Tax=Pseudactinotalea suaedae TaxID=1524924 RepID=UPI0012E1B893|nr:maleylpyruvate isomerase family mycothiol-dependent enzyme [Pseudactinotalea suaedae]